MHCAVCGEGSEASVNYCIYCGAAMTEHETHTTEKPAPGEGNLAAVARSLHEDTMQRIEKVAFVLSIGAAGLVILPIPILDWFALPAALIVLILAFLLWQNVRHQQTLLPYKTMTAIVLSSFVMVSHFVFEITAALRLENSTEDALLSLLNGFLEMVF